MLTTCKIDNCPNSSHSKGYCSSHYHRLVRYGDPTIKKHLSKGVGDHPLYKLYHGMLQRCLNPNANKYAYYGGRGITVCQRWQGVSGFENFVSNMGTRPKGYTLERIDNDGNYELDNCTWATKSQQAINQRVRNTNKSGVMGVCLTTRGNWVAYCKRKGKRLVKNCSSKTEAIKMRKQFEMELNV